MLPAAIRKKKSKKRVNNNKTIKLSMSIKKTKEERLKEIINIRHKLNNFGINNESHDEVKRLFQVLSRFVNDGEYIKDKFYLSGYDRIVHIELLPRQYAENVVMIRKSKLH